MSVDSKNAQLYFALIEPSGDGCSDPTEYLDEETLAAFIDGGLAPEQRNLVCGHIANCSDCFNRLTALQDTCRQLGLLASDKRVGSVSTNWLRKLFSRWVGAGIGGGLAATLSVLFFTGILGGNLTDGLIEDLNHLNGQPDVAELTLFISKSIEGDADSVWQTSREYLPFVKRGLATGFALAVPDYRPPIALNDAADTTCVVSVDVSACSEAQIRAFDVGLWLALTSIQCDRLVEPPKNFWSHQSKRLQSLAKTAEGAPLNTVNTTSIDRICQDGWRLIAALDQQ